MMTKEKLDELVGAALERRRLLAEQKGKEYTQGNPDRLANFRGAADAIDAQLREGLCDEQRMFAVWLIFYGKHFDAVKSFFKHGKEFSNEGIDGRIDDMQVYLDLLRGIVAEMKDRSVETPAVEPCILCGEQNFHAKGCKAVEEVPF